MNKSKMDSKVLDSILMKMLKTVHLLFDLFEFFNQLLILLARLLSDLKNLVLAPVQYITTPLRRETDE
jgi:hypothetical protein